MKNEMNGLVKRFLPAPYVAGGSPARIRPKPIAGESMFDEWVGVTTIVPRSAHARATLDLAVGGDPLDRGCVERGPALPHASCIGENTRFEERRPDAGRELVDARIEVADDVAAVVADELAQLLLLLVLGHRHQPARQIAPAIRGAVLVLESLDLAVRDIVEHVLERCVAIRNGTRPT